MTYANPRSANRFSWGVGFPGLTQQQANWLVRIADEGPYDLQGMTIDPSEWFNVWVDRESAEVLRSALRLLPSNEIANGLREVIEEWLEFSR